MTSEQFLTVQVESHRGLVRIALAGELDMLTVRVLKDHLSQAEGEGVTEMTLDLRDLTFIDATGMRALLDARADADANGHRLILSGVNGRARRLFALTGTEFLLNDREAVVVLDTSPALQSSQPAQT